MAKKDVLTFFFLLFTNHDWGS